MLASAVCLILAILYVPKANLTSPTFLLALVCLAVALYLFFTSGTQYQTTRFEVTHGAWHILTGPSMFLVLKSEGK